MTGPDGKVTAIRFAYRLLIASWIVFEIIAISDVHYDCPDRFGLGFGDVAVRGTASFQLLSVLTLAAVFGSGEPASRPLFATESSL